MNKHRLHVSNEVQRLLMSFFSNELNNGSEVDVGSSVSQNADL